jgi:hypothetical protein
MAAQGELQCRAGADHAGAENQNVLLHDGSATTDGAIRSVEKEGEEENAGAVGVMASRCEA